MLLGVSNEKTAGIVVNDAFFNFGSFYFLPKIVILNWGARHHLLPLQRSYFKAISLLATNKPNTYLLIVE